MSSLGEEYRQILAEKAAAAPPKIIKPNAQAAELSRWFNGIATKLPGVLKEALQSLREEKAPPTMEWKFPKDFTFYEGISLKSLDGYKKLSAASQKLDIGFNYHVEEGRNSIDDRIKTLTVRAYPESPGRSSYVDLSHDG